MIIFRNMIVIIKFLGFALFISISSPAFAGYSHYERFTSTADGATWKRASNSHCWMRILCERH